MTLEWEILSYAAVAEAIMSSKKHVSKKIEALSEKVEDQTETFIKSISSDVTEMKSITSQIGQEIEEMMSGLDETLEILCQAAGVQGNTSTKV